MSFVQVLTLSRRGGSLKGGASRSHSGIWFDRRGCCAPVGSLAMHRDREVPGNGLSAGPEGNSEHQIPSTKTVFLVRERVGFPALFWSKIVGSVLSKLIVVEEVEYYWPQWWQQCGTVVALSIGLCETCDPAQYVRQWQWPLWWRLRIKLGDGGLWTSPLLRSYVHFVIGRVAP
ncbi:hypothetical protein L7F22_007203 [Adiantum nelumboides]|nr:hypothetical protein [Adiantum nelumboides]